MRELMKRRAELQDLIEAERCRLEHASVKTVRQSLEKHLKMLAKELAAIEKEIQALAKSDDEFSRRAGLMQTVTGVGAVTAYTLLAFMPAHSCVKLSCKNEKPGRRKCLIAACPFCILYDRNALETKRE